MAVESKGGLTYTLRHGTLLLNPTSSPLNLNLVPFGSRQLIFGAGRHFTKAEKEKNSLHIKKNKSTYESYHTQKITLIYLPHATRSLQFSGS